MDRETRVLVYSDIKCNRSDRNTKIYTIKSNMVTNETVKRIRDILQCSHKARKITHGL